MGVDLNRSKAAVGSPPLGRVFSNVRFRRRGANVPPREVIRCQQCRLVQFRTASGRCRRCAILLPPKLVLVRRVANPEESSPTLPRQFPVRPPSPPGPSFLRHSHSERPLIGVPLVRLRRARGLSQTQLAKRAGIPRSYVSRMENDHLTPGPRIAARLAATLGVAIVDLLPSESECGSDGLLPKDPLCARLLSEFSRLERRGRAAVLAQARRMAAEGEVT